jgi:K+-transporting ATPase ATPase A chain
MKTPDLVQFLVFFGALILLAPPLGRWMAAVFEGHQHLLSRPLRGIERGIYSLAGVNPKEEMGWKAYAFSLLAFNLVGFIFLFALQMLQGFLPLNPAGLGGVSWHSAVNTAMSFVTNTNWQGYAGETTMSYLTQCVGLAVQNFVSAATGIAVAIALARGIARRSSRTIGNFWCDLVRATVYVLLPLSLLLSFLLVAQGVVQTLSPYVNVVTIEGAKQTLPLGPVASQVAIKQLGTNGGGFFNANSAHPFENPTPLTNFLEMFAIFLIPAGLVFTFGQMTKAPRHAWVIFSVMTLLFTALFAAALASEWTANPSLGLTGSLAGSLEGKETRFGVFGSVFFAMVTTSASCGAINALHSSLSPLAGGLAMFNMHLGEVIFGGVGAGLYGMLLYILLTVFLAGLMVGRSPEYLGKKIEGREMMMVILAILAPSAMILLGTGISVVVVPGLAGLSSQGPHGFSEVFYAFTSAASNNGSAFAGLSANSIYYNLMLALAMLVGRFAIIFPMLAVAGSFAGKKHSPPSPGTFEVDTPLFGLLLVGVLIIVGGLTFFPGLALGPMVEHFLMLSGKAM